MSLSTQKSSVTTSIQICRQPSAIGDLRLAFSQKGLLALLLPGQDPDILRSTLRRRFLCFELREQDEVETRILDAQKAIEHSLQGRPFVMPRLDLELRDFTRQVLDAICRIQPGQTRSYGDIARDIGNPRASRAVGQACHSNPVPLLIPCHRVIGSRGRLGGFAGGLPMKQKLLRREAALLV